MDNINKFRNYRHRFYEWRYELDFTRKVILALNFAILTGILAQIRLPTTIGIPVTGQVFGVLLAGVLLGSKFGTLSQGLYVGLGAVGIPWFAGAGGGFSHFTGATGGFLVGFVVAAALIGWFTERHTKTREYPYLLGLMMLGVGIIYLLGAIWFSFVTGMGLVHVLTVVFAYFIVADVVKAVAAASLGVGILTKKAYGAEIVS